MSLASALPQLSEEAAQAKRTAILATLLSGQSDEGGWANASARMREDDPIIATSFALIALGRLVEAPE